MTVAEVFILLLFLLMLLFLSLSQQWEANADNLNKVKDSLREVSAEREELKQESEVLRDKIRTLSQQRDRAKQQVKRAEQELSDARRLLDGDEGTFFEEMQEQRERAQQLEEEVQKNEKRAQQLETELGAMVTLLEKGVNPPCWYRKVPDSDRASGEREKAYYSFDVGVFEDHLIVRRGDTPPGGAEDDTGGSFADEAEALNFDSLPYDQPLNDREFEQHFEPIWQAGKTGKVRSYSCIFWVRVWDKTAPGAKIRWKQAHDKVLEGLFGTYQVQDDPWLPIAADS
ncbi:MAG: hypothetical protein F4X81_00625 [Gammaproteobacteria bacterium]|nr:hypothetical protein [Gammaproteobacteria bacterium]MYE49951.1 hypothetical protein [Gammaproteobacteria bacterium]MYF48956.1 hypothetical protein [Gammaproteobacteria bacterium]MYH14856.1 hypothetical protein [Gammaproteobacteria bacterium]MYK84299.1 hypothetical protein [Gammaproteobacteria bacterium]